MYIFLGVYKLPKQMPGKTETLKLISIENMEKTNLINFLKSPRSRPLHKEILFQDIERTKKERKKMSTFVNYILNIFKLYL